MVTSLSDRIKTKLNETAKTREELVREMGFENIERGLELLEKWVDQEEMPGTQQQVKRLAAVLDGSVIELNLLIEWEFIGERLDRLESQHREAVMQ
ncbi:MAG: hypothetical protein ABEK50_00360 [bacterium]